MVTHRDAMSVASVLRELVAPLSRDRCFAQALADLQVYVRQHHAERDLAAIGRSLIEEEEESGWPVR